MTASGWIYRVQSRPAWNTRFTLLQFNLTAAALGPLLAAALGVSGARWLAVAAAAMAGAQLVIGALRFVRLIASGSHRLPGIPGSFRPRTGRARRPSLLDRRIGLLSRILDLCAARATSAAPRLP